MRTITRGAATRSRLLEAAKTELVERGGTLEVASVASRAGVSVGLIYRHFASKSGLVAAVVEDFYDRLERSVLGPDPAPGADWATRERLRTERDVAFHYAEPLAPIILSRLHREPEVAAVEARRLTRQIEAARRNIAQGQASGEIPADLDAGLAGAMVLGGIRQALGQVLSRPALPPGEALADELWRLVVSAVRCLPPRRQAKESPDAEGDLREDRADRARDAEPPRGPERRGSGDAPETVGDLGRLQGR